MVRLTEIGLFLLPFIVFGICWRVGSFDPSPPVLAGSVVALAVLAVLLVWFAGNVGLRPGAAYVPARLVNGEVIPGHAAP